MASGDGSAPQTATSQKRTRGGQRSNVNARKHGVHALKRAVRELGSRTVDRRTTVGRALAAWRADLIDDYGGEDKLSTAELALIDEAVVTKLLLGSVNAWLLERGDRLVNKRRGALVQAVRDRSALVRELRETLTTLGTKRRVVPPSPLAEVMARYERPVGDPMGTPRLGRAARSVPREFRDDSENPSDASDCDQSDGSDQREEPAADCDHGDAPDDEEETTP
ncbi:MAG: hypothetical protein AB1689_19440 [Thermodesulfobacteriota bacterium]